MQQTHKELTAHIRNRLKAAGIAARCKMQDGCDGNKVIAVDVPAYDAQFTEEQQAEILLIASCNRLTFVRGLPLGVAGTRPHSFKFYMARNAA